MVLLRSGSPIAVDRPFRAYWNFPGKTDVSQPTTEPTSSQSHAAIDCLVPLLRDGVVRRETGVDIAPQLRAVLQEAGGWVALF